MLTRLNRGRAKLSSLSLALRSKFALAAFASLLLGVTIASAQVGGGIGGFDLKSPADKVFAFDYNGSGVADHLVLYRPGSGIVYILQNTAGTFTPVYTSSTGIGGYDLMSTYDVIMPFDYNGDGLQDHLLCYRPGAGIVWVLANMGGTFMPVYTSSSGIGGYDLSSTSDVMMPFDYSGNGSAGYLVAFRPGAGMISIMANNSGNFTPVYTSTNGIGSYDLKSADDKMFALDYYGIGVADHLVLYRPGTGIVQILESSNGSFTTMFQSTSGIGGYDLRSPNDRLLAYDYDGLGTLSNIVAIRPGSGTAWIMSSSYFQVSPVLTSSSGLGGFDLLSTSDQVTLMNYTSTGLLPNMVFYRPGTGTIYILGAPTAQFAPVYAQ